MCSLVELAPRNRGRARRKSPGGGSFVHCYTEHLDIPRPFGSIWYHRPGSVALNTRKKVTSCLMVSVPSSPIDSTGPADLIPNPWIQSILKNVGSLTHELAQPTNSSGKSSLLKVHEENRNTGNTGNTGNTEYREYLPKKKTCHHSFISNSDVPRLRGGSKCGPSMTWTCSLSRKNQPQDIAGVKSWKVMKNAGFFLENIIEKYPKITCNQQKSTSTSAWRRARAAPHSSTGPL